jgi:hypothetical protein
LIGIAAMLSCAAGSQTIVTECFYGQVTIIRGQITSIYSAESELVQTAVFNPAIFHTGPIIVAAGQTMVANCLAPV